jgi:hypothetical protein
MQRREQQRRNPSSSGNNYLGGGGSGYSSLPRFEPPDISTTIGRTNSSTSSLPSLRTPTFKGSGMKLGSKKTKQAELLDELGGEVLASAELSVPNTPVAHIPEPTVRKDPRGSLPVVTAER